MKACSSYEHMAIWSQLQFPPHIISAWNRARGVQLRQWPTGILYQWVQGVNSQSRSRHWSRWVKNLSVEDGCFYSSMPAEAVTTAVVEYASFHSLCCVLSRKVKSFKQTLRLLEQCAVSKITTSVRSAVFWPWHMRPQLFCHSLIVLPMTHCSNSAQEFAVQVWQVCEVATVLMETTQLVLS